MSSYRVVQATKRGTLEISERPLVDPEPLHVRIRVEACGICHSDALAVEGVLPNAAFPRVPGHEAIGRIDALGAGVDDWRVGQRVGVGYLGGPCGRCRFCRRGQFVHCLHQHLTGTTNDGGYAEVMYARASGLSAVPEELTSVEAAPLLCAGLTTFNALRNSGARPGELVAIQGIGGLGHLAVQYARRMGFRVAAIARGPEKGELALGLGAHHYIDGGATDPAKALQELGGASLILATASNSRSQSGLIAGLLPAGKLLIVGLDGGPIEISSSALVLSARSVAGSLTGSAQDGEDTLSFSVLQNIRSRNEIIPFENAAAGYARMMSNAARFRIVLAIGQG
ncbi:MAG TPA: alcohol dehydrogenase [Candidatus Polarisedimenticolaceae bacterium]|nr:alcohol dehydrogenase [Candidatus Polarisedimenticolaceae bacterium]